MLQGPAVECLATCGTILLMALALAPAEAGHMHSDCYRSVRCAIAKNYAQRALKPYCMDRRCLRWLSQVLMAADSPYCSASKIVLSCPALIADRAYAVNSELSEKRDLNPRPRPWQGRALPTELFSHLGASKLKN